MEIKAELKQPYTENERINFIVEQNHQLGYEIRETDISLEAWGYTEEEKQQQERQRLDFLILTPSDVERAIYKVKGMDFDDILAMVKDNPTIDVKALKIEFKANNFYRGNPYISQVGTLLGFTSEQMDRFFDTKDYHYLTTCKLTINAMPTEATVTGAGSYPYGTLVDYKVELKGYKPYIGSIELRKDTELNIELEKIEEMVDKNNIV